MKRENKKGISGIIAAVLMIGITLAAGLIVWGVVSNLVNQNLDNAESCFGNYGKVALNNRYTCYNDTANANEFVFAISVGDIKLDGVVVRISSPDSSKSFTIMNISNTIADLQSYSRNPIVQLPGKNGGLTYRAINMLQSPDAIDIAPIINGKQCDVSDTINQIDICSSLA